MEREREIMADSDLIIHDITRDLLKAEVYPGDPRPSCERVLELEKGDGCNVCRLSMGSHSGTHIDAPSHFLPGGKTVGDIDFNKLMGPCSVLELDGVLDAASFAGAIEMEYRRILLKGDFTFTPEAARVLTKRGTYLIGVESLSLGSGEADGEIHRELLKNDVVILEALDLSAVKPGHYYLFSAPLAVNDCDGAPCRAVLFETDDAL